ncbi:Hydroxyproline dehydrogenase [Holothuria leucospilota]|uniref:Proline dehydrogenase n=1 Tax=Holothuria leucospilota TaxID=206669 RepID=A0A9Q1CG96_HOLLE|nr:Hydroxyproline dehydrogenase [Holothuria leucospilota]
MRLIQKCGASSCFIHNLQSSPSVEQNVLRVTQLSASMMRIRTLSSACSLRKSLSSAHQCQHLLNPTLTDARWLKATSDISVLSHFGQHSRRMKSSSVFPSVEAISKGKNQKWAENRDVDFSSPEVIYKTKKTSELLRALFILQMSSFDSFVKNSMMLMSFGQRILGKRIFDSIMRRTFFGQFAIEEQKDLVEREKQRLEDCGIASIFAVTAEEDIGEDVNCFNEDRYDRNLQSMLFCLELTEQMCRSKSWPKLTQLKVTSYVKADVLAKLSEILNRHDGEFHNPGKVTLSNFVKGLEGTMEDIPDMTEVEMKHVRRSLLRLNKIAQESVDSNIHLLVDAEKVNINPCLSLIAMAMMKKYNQETAVVWNTYQCYLKATEDNLTSHANLANLEDICFGVKLVRGAYMDGEQANATSLGKEVPINPSYEATNEVYDKMVEYLMNWCIQDGRKETRFIIATHNEESVLKAVSLMKDLGIAAVSGKVVFGQLYGMCDHVSFALGQAGYLVYKSIVVGPIEDVLLYLTRRAQENNTVFHRLQKEKDLLKKEIWRRMVSSS